VPAQAHVRRRLVGLRAVTREAPCRGTFAGFENRLSFGHLAKHVVVDVCRNARRNEYARLERHLISVVKKVNDDDLVCATSPFHEFAGEVTRICDLANELAESFPLLTGYVIASS
jgi:hypothetical protein